MVEAGRQPEARLLLLQQAAAATRLKEVQDPRRTVGLLRVEGVTRRVAAMAPQRLGAVAALHFKAAPGPGLAEGRPEPRLARWPLCRGLGGRRGGRPPASSQGPGSPARAGPTHSRNHGGHAHGSRYGNCPRCRWRGPCLRSGTPFARGIATISPSNQSSRASSGLLPAPAECQCCWTLALRTVSFLHISSICSSFRQGPVRGQRQSAWPPPTPRGSCLHQLEFILPWAQKCS
jgi:hypothetical protein